METSHDFTMSRSPPPLVPTNSMALQVKSLDSEEGSINVNVNDPTEGSGDGELPIQDGNDDQFGDNDFEDEDEEMIDYPVYGAPSGHPPISILPNTSKAPAIYTHPHGQSSGTGDNSSDNNSDSVGASNSSADANPLRVNSEIFHQHRSPFQQQQQQTPLDSDLLGAIRRSKFSRPKRSIVHEHFKYNERENRYYCNYCPLNYVKTRDSSTGALQLHLRKKHAQLIFGSTSADSSYNRPKSPNPIFSNWLSGNSNNSGPSLLSRKAGPTSPPNVESVIIKTEVEGNSTEIEESSYPPGPALQNQHISDQAYTYSCDSIIEERNTTLKRNRRVMSETTNSPAAGGVAPAERLPGTLGVIGGGNMAKAILLPLFELRIICPSKVMVSGTNLERLGFWQNLGCATVTDNRKVITDSDTILWSVKPQMFPKVLDKIRSQIGAQILTGFYNKLHISIMAGISLLQFHEALVKSLFWAKTLNGVDNQPEFSPFATSGGTPAVRIARVMPNMGLRVKAGCAAYCLGERATPQDDQYLKALFSQTGVCVKIDESQAHAHGVMIGCAVGFMFPLLEALSDGAVRVGIPRESSLKLAAQAMKGAAELFLQEGTHPAVLKDSVCSPGGTTIAGIAELEKNGVRSALISAVEASTRRSEELGKLADSK